MHHPGKQGALQALDILHAAHAAQRSIILSERSGDVRLASLLDQAGGALVALLTPERDDDDDLEERIRQVAKEKLVEEAMLFKHGLSEADRFRLHDIFEKISRHPAGAGSWRHLLEAEVAALRERDDTRKLAKVLDSISVLDRDDNAAVYRYAIAMLAEHPELETEQALNRSVAQYLRDELGLDENSAANTAPRVRWAMMYCRTGIMEAVEVADIAGRLLKHNRSALDMAPALEVAYLMRHYEYEMDHALKVWKAMHGAGLRLTAFLRVPALMAEYRIDAAEAGQVQQLADQIRTKPETEHLTRAQATEMAYVQRRYDMGSAQALAVVNMATRIRAEKRLPDADALALAMKRLQTMVGMQRALPRGWGEAPARDESGTRILEIGEVGQRRFVDVIHAAPPAEIDPEGSLPAWFPEVADQVRMRFEPGNRRLGPGDSRDIMVSLLALAKDRVVAQRLCRLVFAADAGGVADCIAVDLAQPGQARCELLPAKGRRAAGGCLWYSALPAGEDSIRLGCTLHDKHFVLRDAKTGEELPINGEFDPATPASEDDWTMRAFFEVEYRRADLERGIVNPVFVQAPEIELRIEPDWDLLDGALLPKVEQGDSDA